MTKKQERVERIQERRHEVLSQAEKIRSWGKTWKELSKEDRVALLSADIIRDEDRLEKFQEKLAQETEVIPTEESLTASVFNGAQCFCCHRPLELGESSILSANLVVSKMEQSGRKVLTKAHFLKKVATLEIKDFQAAMCCRMCNPQVESWLSKNCQVPLFCPTTPPLVGLLFSLRITNPEHSGQIYK